MTCSMTCAYCKFAHVIVDYGSGDSICTSCGTVLNRDFAFQIGYNDHCESVIIDGYKEANDVETKILYDIVYQFDISEEEVQTIKRKYTWFIANHSYLVFKHKPVVFISALICKYSSNVNLTDIKLALQISTTIVSKICSVLKEY
jgi:hypothetical protein